MTERTPAPTPALPRALIYMSHGSLDGKYPAKERSAIITEVSDPTDGGGEPIAPEDRRVKVCVLNPQGIFFTDWLRIQQPGDPDYGKAGTVHWPVFVR